MKTNFNLIKGFLYLGALLTLNFNMVQAANITWNNANANNNWSDNGNWVGGTKPGSVDIAVFDATSSTNCNIDAAINIAGIDVQSGYSGTITQGDYAITIGTSHASFAFGTGGAFVGDDDKSITISGNFTLSAGSFTSTSGTLLRIKNYTFSGGAFVHNNGTVKCANTSSLPVTLTGNATFFNLTFDAVYSNNTYTITSDNTLTVNNLFTLSGISKIIINTGTIDVVKDITISNINNSGGGDALINIMGSGNHVITGLSGTGKEGQGKLPKVTINTTGSVTLLNTVSVTHNWTFTAASGGFITGGSILAFCDYVSTAAYTITGTCSFNKVIFHANGFVNCTIANTLTIDSLLTISGTSIVRLSTGTINVSRDLTVTNTTNNTLGGGSATININGSNNHIITGISGANKEGQGRLPKLTINTTGTVTITNTISVGNDWTFTAASGGGITTTGSTIVFCAQSSNVMTISGTQIFDNIMFYPTSYSMAYTISNTLEVNSALMLGGNLGIVLNTGIINAKGDIIITNNYTSGGGTATINIIGTIDQTIRGLSGTGKENMGNLPKININKSSGGLTLVDNINISNDLTRTSLSSLTTTGSTLILLGPIVVKGDLALDNLTFYPISGYQTVNIGTISSPSAITTTGKVKIFKGITVNIYYATGNSIN